MEDGFSTETKKSNKIWLVLGIIVIVLLGVLLIFNAANSGSSTGKAVTGSEKEPIKIGSIGPLTGDVSSIGLNEKAAIELAVDEINSKGGISGRKIQVIYEDGKCSAKDGSNAANKLMNIDNVVAIIGGTCSSETIASAPIAEETKTVMISPCSSSPKITEIGDYIFRDYPSDSYQGAEAANFIYNNLGKKKVAVLYVLSDWGVGIQQVFEPKFKDLGGEIVASEGYEQTTKDLRTQLTKIKQANPDVIYFLGYTEASAIGLKQIKELGINAEIVGGDAWDDKVIFEKAGDAAEGIIFFIPYAPLTSEFKESMKEKLGSNEITICSSQAYDGVYLLKQVIEKVGTDPTKIKDELYKIKDYPGVSGTISFDSNGDLEKAQYAIKVVRNGNSQNLN
ncbi:MAG: ABC transporter substrate-binding protein [Candidatus Nanoarchaeia archaeon]|nr:ABC transporter substrate-binding protein [Candidatus Nanoarchaeia archaeon]